MKWFSRVSLYSTTLLFALLLSNQAEAQVRRGQPDCIQYARQVYRNSVQACDQRYIDEKDGTVSDPKGYQDCLDNALARYRQSLFMCRGKPNPFPPPITDPSRFPSPGPAIGGIVKNGDALGSM